MDKITLDKLHSLLQSLAEFSMTELATKQVVEQTTNEMNSRFELIEADIRQVKADIQEMKANNRLTRDDVQQTRVDLLQTKDDVQQIKRGVGKILDGMDAQAKQLDIIRTEQVAYSKAIDRHEERITALEGDKTDYRIRDKGESKYSRKK